MNRAHLHRAAALLVALVVTGGLFALAGAAPLAVVAGACWGVGVGVGLRVRRLDPGVPNDDGWSDVRWTGLGVGLVTLAALVGVAPGLDLDPGVQFGLSVLVLGAGLAGYATATMTAVERHLRDPTRAPERAGEPARAPAAERGRDASGDRR